MSLLDAPTDELRLYPEIQSTDGDGNPVRRPGPAYVAVSGRMQPLRADEAASLGQQFSTTYRFVTRGFPAGAWALARWAGRDWDVVGEPIRRRGSERVAHDEVILTARAPEAL